MASRKIYLIITCLMGTCASAQVNLSKRFNEHARVSLHNISSDKDMLKQDVVVTTLAIPNPVANQRLKFQEALAAGVRSFKIPVHPVSPSQVIKLEPGQQQAFRDTFGGIDGFLVEGENVKPIFTPVKSMECGKAAIQQNWNFQVTDKGVITWPGWKPKKCDKQDSTPSHSIKNMLKDPVTVMISKAQGGLPQGYQSHTMQTKEWRDATKRLLPAGLQTYIGNDLWKIDASARPLLGLLQELKKFLDSNPQEIVEIFFNNFSPLMLLVNAFVASGLTNYIHIQDVNQPWPTLDEMIKSGKRLVIFIDSDIPQAFIALYPWLKGFHRDRAFVFTSGASTFKSVKDLENDDTGVSGEGFQLLKGKQPAIMGKLPHDVTSGIAGSYKLAKQVNTEESVRKHVKKFRDVNGRLPTIISVDFWEPGDGLNKVVQEMNEGKLS